MLAAKVDRHLYILADAKDTGFALFHYEHETDDGSRYRLSYTLGKRVIQAERKVVSMNNMLRDVAGTVGNQRGVAPMNLGASEMVPAAGEGVSGAVDSRRLQREALAYGYVAGYIMGSAPATTLAMSKKKVKDGDAVYSIVAKESKPSRPLSVLMALPKRCVMRAGTLARPTDIMSGTVDFMNGEEGLVFQHFPVEAAIAYISALGNRLPEYAPNVSDMGSQWSPEDILSGRPDVTFVYVHPTENKSRTSGSQEKFRFSLKSTSDRRSLYTEGNHVCLRALEHMSIKCGTEQEAYELNEAAFAAWRYRKPKTETVDGLTKACAECPGQIWKKTYDINGQAIEGIGSVFFMAGNEETTEGGEKVIRRQLMYYPWYQTGARRPTSPSRVERMVKRTLRPAEGDKKERMITHPVLWKDNPNHPMFKPYTRFVNYILQTGYIREDKLKGMGGRAAKASRKQAGMTPDQKLSLKQYMRMQDVERAIQEVQDESADRSVLNTVRG